MPVRVGSFAILLWRMIKKRHWCHILFEGTSETLPPPEKRDELTFEDHTGWRIPPEYHSFVLEFATKVTLYRANLWMLRGKAWFFIVRCNGDLAFYRLAFDSRRIIRQFPNIKPGGVIFGPSYTRPEFRGRGILGWAAKECFRYFTERGIRHFYADCAVTNKSSERAISKSGLQRVGTFEGTSAFFGLIKTKRRIAP